jgi:hypothetical protein
LLGSYLYMGVTLRNTQQALSANNPNYAQLRHVVTRFKHKEICLRIFFSYTFFKHTIFAYAFFTCAPSSL